MAKDSFHVAKFSLDRLDMGHLSPPYGGQVQGDKALTGFLPEIFVRGESIVMQIS